MIPIGRPNLKRRARGIRARLRSSGIFKEPTHPSMGTRKAYWKANLRLLGMLLSIWATVSFGAGILFVDFLNRITIPGTGFKLGFWFAQQGSIYTFVVLVFVYAKRMQTLDKKYGVSEDEGEEEERT